MSLKFKESTQCDGHTLGTLLGSGLVTPSGDLTAEKRRLHGSGTRRGNEGGGGRTVMGASSYGRAKRTGDNLCCRKESCANHDSLVKDDYMPMLY